MTMLLPKPPRFNTVADRAALDYAEQFEKFNSVLRPIHTMSVQRVEEIINHTKRMLLWMAVAEEGEQDWIVRSLHRGDMPLTTTTQRDWFETTGVTSDQFITAAIGNGTVISDDTFIGIYGARWFFTENRAQNANRIPFRPPVTAVRFVVGGTRVAEWDLFSIFVATGNQGANSSGVQDFGVFQPYPDGIGESPILVSQNKTLLVQYYEVVAGTATDFGIQLLGLVVERAGGRDGLNP